MRPRGESGLNENLGAIPSSVTGSSLISGESEAEDTCSESHWMATHVHESTCHKITDAHRFSLLPSSGDGLGEENTSRTETSGEATIIEHLAPFWTRVLAQRVHMGYFILIRHLCEP